MLQSQWFRIARPPERETDSPRREIVAATREIWGPEGSKPVPPTFLCALAIRMSSPELANQALSTITNAVNVQIDILRRRNALGNLAFDPLLPTLHSRGDESSNRWLQGFAAWWRNRRKPAFRAFPMWPTEKFPCLISA